MAIAELTTCQGSSWTPKPAKRFEIHIHRARGVIGCQDDLQIQLAKTVENCWQIDQERIFPPKDPIHIEDEGLDGWCEVRYHPLSLLRHIWTASGGPAMMACD